MAARIRYADRGYAGFFDTIKVDEAALGRVYQFDLALLQGVEEVRAAAEAAAGAASGLGGAVQKMIAALDALDTRLAEREAILGGMK